MASEIALLAGLAFVGALIVGVTGFGSALVTIPLATHFVGLENPRNAARDEWRRLVPMILVGTALGVTLLVNLPRAVGMFLLGAFVLSYALYSLVRRGPPRVIHPGWAWLAGLCGGITSTLFGAGGPPYAAVPAALLGLWLARHL